MFVFFSIEMTRCSDSGNMHSTYLAQEKLLFLLNGLFNLKSLFFHNEV